MSLGGHESDGQQAWQELRTPDAQLVLADGGDEPVEGQASLAGEAHQVQGL